MIRVLPHVRSAGVVVACATYAAYCLLTQPPGPVTAPDTVAYLEQHPNVPVGYPLFLQAVGPRGTMLVQPLIFSAALAALGICLLRATGSTALALSVVVGTMMTPGLATLHASLLTESLFMSALAAFLAASAAFIRQPSWRTAVLAGVIGGLAATIRRPALAWLPVLIVIGTLAPRSHPQARWRMSFAAVGPALVILAIDRVVSSSMHDTRLTSLTGPHLFAKAALLDQPTPLQSKAPSSRLAGELDTLYQPVRSLIASAPRELRGVLTLYYETCLQAPCVEPLRRSLAPLGEAEINELFAQAGIERITRALLPFFQLTITNYSSFWTAYRLRHPVTAERLSAFLAANRPLPFEREAFKVGPGEPIVFASQERIRWLQPLVMAAGCFTAVVAGVGFVQLIRGRASPLLAMAFVAALTAHATLLFSATAAAGLSRFIVGVSPALVTAFLAGAWFTGFVVRRTFTETRSARRSRTTHHQSAP